LFPFGNNEGFFDGKCIKHVSFFKTNPLTIFVPDIESLPYAITSEVTMSYLRWLLAITTPSKNEINTQLNMWLPEIEIHNKS